MKTGKGKLLANRVTLRALRQILDKQEKKMLI
jgi:hypothetical protein